ncbi:MAG: GNAT family N-acetyltransferase, partial [bacterium]|nr:GNAT family N-acetyltransferase [bacterium]
MINSNTIKIIEISLPQLTECLRGIPEFGNPAPPGQVEKRCGETRYLALAAEIDGQKVGCKLGYAEDNTTFYSWLGGVLPGYRKRGVAQALLDTQEQWVWKNNFKKIKVKSMNGFPDMLRFLIANFYQIIGVEGDSPQRLKV